jgi:hypothetical protein
MEAPGRFAPWKDVLGAHHRGNWVGLTGKRKKNHTCQHSNTSPVVIYTSLPLRSRVCVCVCVCVREREREREREGYKAINVLAAQGETVQRA